MAAKSSSTKQSTNEAKSDLAVSYNEFKEHEGQRYTGMKIGRSHKWYYDQGEWKEKKITPDIWQIGYAVTKRRAGRAPEGSGVPVGTEYQWYVLAHQNVAKQTANDYTTSLTGLKFKIAHKRAGSEKWSATPRNRDQELPRRRASSSMRVATRSPNETRSLTHLPHRTQPPPVKKLPEPREERGPFIARQIAALLAVSQPRSGDKVVFVPFTRGVPVGDPMDVLIAFLDERDGDARSRPVGVAIDRQGALLVADDVGNTIWRVRGVATRPSLALSVES
jgi:hypothetical protein